MKDVAKNLSQLFAVGLTALLFGVAVQHTATQTPSLEDKMVIWLLTIVLMGTAAHALGGLVQKWTGLHEMVGWLALGIGMTNIPGLKSATHHLFTDPRYGLEHIVEIVAQLGVWLLLTEAGLETNLKKLVGNAPRGTGSALIGVLVPFASVYGSLSVIFPDLNPLARVLVAAIITSTSLGVASIFFKGEKILASSTAQLVMAVAAIDDIIGLLILTGITGARNGSGSALALVVILAKAIIFFAATLTAGVILAPQISRFMARMNGGEAMRLKVALASSVVFAWIAHRWGLSPLMGAYAGGVFLTEVHFKNFEAEGGEHGVEHLLKGVHYIVVPIFLVSVAMKVDLRLFASPRPIALFLTYLVSLVVGKLIAGQVAGPGNDKATLAWGAVPRGEVALVIAGMGYSAGQIGSDIMSVAVMAMVGSILLTSWQLPRAIANARARNPRIFDSPVEDVTHS